MKNLITADYLSGLSTKKKQDREALIVANAKALVDEVLTMAEYEAKTYGFTASNFNHSRIPPREKGRGYRVQAVACPWVQGLSEQEKIVRSWLLIGRKSEMGA